MSVEEIYIPPKTGNVDPVAPKKTPSYWEEQAKEARARREFLQEQRIAEEISNPVPQDPPFKVSGGINLGNIDIQENMRRSEEKAELERKEAAARIAEERARREASEARVRDIEISMLREQISTQMSNLEKMISTNKPVQQRSFMEQYEEIVGMANKLGMAERQQVATGSSSDDARLKLEIMRIQAELAKEEREFKREMRNDERRWQVELAKLDIEKKNHADKLQHEKDRNELFSNAFKNVGSAIASGLMATAEASAAAGPVARSAPTQERPPTHERPGPRPRSTPPSTEASENLSVEVPYGRAGEVTCPTCQEPIGIGPNTTKAMCAGCGLTCMVERVASIPEPEQGNEPTIEELEKSLPDLGEKQNG